MHGPLLHAAAPPAAAGALTAAGPWALGHVVGRGGTGVVYEARDPARAALAVVKVARPGLSAEATARFPDEAQMLSLFRHDAVVRGYGGGALSDGRPYLAMEYVRGTSVARHARGISVGRRLAVFRDVCEAVAVVHRRRVVHCDLKPGNVFVTAGGRVKLLDFGSAQRLGPPAAGAAGGGAPAVTPLLTPDFAAPEQILRTAVSAATDVYALGLVLHDLLCGRRRRVPWGLSGGGMTGGTTVFSGTLTGDVGDEPGVQSLFRAVDVDAMRRTIRRIRLDWRVGEVLCTALQTDPLQRYASAADLALAVERVLRSLAGRTGPPGQRPPPSASPRPTPSPPP